MGTQKVEQNLYPPLYEPLAIVWLDSLMDWNKYGPRMGALSHTHDLTRLKHSTVDLPPTLNVNIVLVLREVGTFLIKP